MKKTLLLLVACLFYTMTVDAQQFNKGLPSTLSLAIYTTVDVLEVNNYYYKLETESNNAVNFHGDLRVTKLDISGTIIWSKRYDAGVDSSLVGSTISKTIDIKMVISAYYSPNNVYPPVGETILEIDTAGVVQWSVLFPGFNTTYSPTQIIQLADSSIYICSNHAATIFATVLKLNANATSVSGIGFQNTSSLSEGITYFNYRNNKFTICFYYGDFIVMDTAMNVLSSRKYLIDTSLPYLRQSTTANGDHVFISDAVSGGSLSGKVRVFRSDSLGNLIWAKTITGWNSFTNHTPFQLFDIVQGLNVFENTSGNIVANVLNEGSTCMTLTLDANGNYLSNRITHAAVLKECTNGDYLYASNTSSVTLKQSIVKVNYLNSNPCDSIIDVIVDPGTDSISTSPPSITSTPIAVTMVNLPINVTNTSIVLLSYCSLTAIDQVIHDKGNELSVYPNPASSIIRYELKNKKINSIALYNYLGENISILSRGINEIDLSSVPSGIYFLRATSERNVYSKKIVKY